MHLSLESRTLQLGHISPEEALVKVMSKIGMGTSASPLLWGLLSGVLMGLTWVPTLPPVFIAICFVPIWWFWIQRPEFKSILISGWVASTVGVLIACPWVASTMRNFWPISWASATAGTVAFAIIAYIYVPIVGLIAWFLSKRLRMGTLHTILLFPILQALFETLFALFLHTHFGYPWLWSHLPVVQLADLVGVSGLSLVTYFLNFAVLWTILEWKSGKKLKARKFASMALTTFAFLNFAGVWHAQQWDHSDYEFSALLVQPNLLPHEIQWARMGSFSSYYNIHHLLATTREGLKTLPAEGKKLDAVIWPESAVPVDLRKDSPQALRVRNFAQELGTPLITGSRIYDTEEIFYAAMTVIDANGLPSGFHKKTELMPFGEYIPGQSLIPALSYFDQSARPLSLGNGPTVLNIGGVKVGAGICFESIISDFSGTLSENAAEIFLFINNDFWLGDTLAPWQHYQMSVARALEYRRPLIQVGNSGISVAVAANGKVIAQSGLFEVWSDLVKVPYIKSPPRTLYSKINHLFPTLTFIALLLTCAFGRNRTES
jgi:apolipoprotein N-acyltransferase